MLVGGFNHLEKYESQWQGLSIHIMENKKCLNHQPEHHHNKNTQVYLDTSLLPYFSHMCLKLKCTNVFFQNFNEQIIIKSLNSGYTIFRQAH